MLHSFKWKDAIVLRSLWGFEFLMEHLCILFPIFALMNDNTIMSAASAARATQERKSNISNVDQTEAKTLIQGMISKAIINLNTSIRFPVCDHDSYAPCLKYHDIYITPGTIEELKEIGYEVDVNISKTSFSRITISWKHLIAQ